jgi:PAS domain S-box-containing protein
MDGVTHRILLIEDDTDLRETVSECLSHEGFEVILAENGSQGIQKAIQVRPDVVVCDITMPGITGYEVFNILRQINSTSVIPFIFLSAKASKEDILLGLHLGADDYITKPFDIPHLISVIKLRIEQRQRVIALNDEKFTVLLRNVFSGAIILNGQVIEYANDHFARTLGYYQEELSGNSLINIVFKEDVKKIADLLTKCSDGVIKEFESQFRAIQKNSNLLPVSIKGSIIEYKGEKRLVATLQENTGRAGNGSVEQIEKTVKLSEREKEILRLICQGLSNAEIAAKLFLSERTIEGHRARIYSKTGTKNAVALAMWAVKRKIINI